MIHWSSPQLLHLVALFPAVAAAALLLWWRRRRDVADALGDAALVRRLAGVDLRAFPRRRAALVVPAAALLGLAAAGPRFGAPERVRAAARGDVVLVLDASNSMRATDVAPNRLARERDAARLLVERLQGARVGLVVFAGSAYVLSPLTADASALNLYLDALDPSIVRQSGSSLSDAVRTAVALLELPEDGTGGSVVVMTDGEALEPGELVDAALDEARARGVPVHTVGIGTTAGTTIPDVDAATGRVRGVKHYPETGEPAVSRLGEDALREAARATGGSYRRITDAGGMRRLADVAARGGGPSRDERGNEPDNRYRWFLALALVLIAADAVTGRPRPAVDDASPASDDDERAGR